MGVRGVLHVREIRSFLPQTRAAATTWIGLAESASCRARTHTHAASRRRTHPHAHAHAHVTRHHQHIAWRATPPQPHARPDPSTLRQARLLPYSYRAML